MRIIIKILVFGILLTSTLPASAAGFARVGTYSFTWEGLFTGGRLTALGGSDMADGSPEALLINPAPLARGNGAELGYSKGEYFFYDYELHNYAGTVEWNFLRINFASQEFSKDDVPLRTAYNPEGTLATFDFRDQMTVMGASYDLGQGLFENPALQWSVGAALRSYFTKLDDESSSVSSLEFGSTIGWTMVHEHGWNRITGAISWQNFSDADLIFDETQKLLPQPLRVGMTMEMAYDRAGYEGDFLKFLLAFTRRHEKGDSIDLTSTDHVGFEVMFLETIALRWGHSTKYMGDVSSWGVGVVWDSELLGPFKVHTDVGKIGFNNVFLNDSEVIWGVRVGYGW